MPFGQIVADSRRRQVCPGRKADIQGAGLLEEVRFGIAAHTADVHDLLRAAAPFLDQPTRTSGDDACHGEAQILQVRTELDAVAERFAERASEHDADLSDAERQALRASVRQLCGDLLDDWLKIAQKSQQEGSSIQYQKEANTPPRRLLHEFMHPDLVDLHPIQRRFRANRSMRDVEPTVEVFVRNLNDWEDR